MTTFYSIKYAIRETGEIYGLDNNLYNIDELHEAMKGLHNTRDIKFFYEAVAQYPVETLYCK